MICLGIESTAHTFGVGIVTSDKKILANVKQSYTTKKGGMIPIKVADHHTRICDEVLKQALEEAKLRLKDIDIIAFSIAPGLGPSLRIGAAMARSLSLIHKLPLVGVNHAIAHLEIGSLLSGFEDPVLLYVSGANTQVISYNAGKYRVFGETLDIGLGNFLDQLARALGLGFPGGPKIEQLAKHGKRFIELPYVVKGMDVSFGGLITKLKNLIKKNKHSKENLCFSVQETAFAMVTEVAERAMAHTQKNKLVLGGGVACNKRLQQMCEIMCKERNAQYFCPPNEFLVDNAAMIAWLGLLMRKRPIKTTESAIRPYERTDEVDVFWKKN